MKKKITDPRKLPTHSYVKVEGISPTKDGPVNGHVYGIIAKKMPGKFKVLMMDGRSVQVPITNVHHLAGPPAWGYMGLIEVPGDGYYCLLPGLAPMKLNGDLKDFRYHRIYPSVKEVERSWYQRGDVPADWDKLECEAITFGSLRNKLAKMEKTTLPPPSKSIVGSTTRLTSLHLKPETIKNLKAIGEVIAALPDGGGPVTMVANDSTTELVEKLANL